MTATLGTTPFASLPMSSRPLVKTCGIMSIEHALAAAAFGADMVGLVFARSRRSLSVEQAASISAALHRLGRRPLLVGVFVNEAPHTMLSIAHSVGLDIIQLSGDESPADVTECAASFPVLKAIRFAEGSTLQSAMSQVTSYRSPVPRARLRFLVDACKAGEYGGSGILSNWRLAAELARHEEILLAGGLTPANVAQAIKEVNPWGVDVSSGIESDEVKDARLIEAFIAGARGRIPLE